MAKQYDTFQPDQLRLIEESPLFFVATAAADGRVNVSPKGRDSLRVAGPNRVIWRNLTGSSNETAGHLRLVNRITLMWCSFTKRPLILRAYGTATMTQRGEPGWDELNARFPPEPGARQIYDVAVEMVQSSCGYAVPFMEFTAERDTLASWAEKRGAEAMPAYWAEKNQTTIDGFPTGVPVE